MPGRTLNKEIFLNTVRSDVANGTTNAASMLKRNCPELSDAHCNDIIGAIINAMNMSEADNHLWSRHLRLFLSMREPQ